MRKVLTATALAVLSGLGASPAFAIGGSQVNAHMLEENAACDAQRRGEAPPYPDLCLPELPLPSDPPQRRRSWR